MNRPLKGFLALACASLVAFPAFAHAHLEKSDPAAGSMPAAPVTHIDLHYSEALEARFSKASLADHDGKPVDAASALDPKDAKHLVLTPKAPLKGGDYSVEWRAVSIDTHKTQGHFTFEIMP
ncbi:MAG TPA: copper homeostasis periplasmic binding protein CopC [Parvibaculum sp.]